MYNWWQSRQIQFTRARPYRKNDNRFVEEKNNSAVRRTVGYLRYDTPEELCLLRAIYQRQTLLGNCFYPWMKLTSKTRRGARVYRRYDIPRTPFQRLMERNDLDMAIKEQLQEVFDQLNPAALKRELTQLQGRLYAVASAKPPATGQTTGSGLPFGRIRLDSVVRHRASLG